MKKLAILLLGVTFFMVSCDDDVEMEDTEAPVIGATITKAVVACDPCQGTDLDISVSVAENDELHEVEIFLQQSFMDGTSDYSNAQSAKLIDIDVHAHDQTYSVDTTYTMDTVHHSTFYLIVNASDHNGNSSTDTATIHVHM